MGEVVGAPEAVTGGFLHRMYAIETTRGEYAIKALNPQIMARPAAMQNFINSEQIASIVTNNIPALPYVTNITGYNHNLITSKYKIA